MGDKQILFGLTVGLLLSVFGGWVTLISQAGWNLLVVGLALTGLSAGLKIYRQLATPAAATPKGLRDAT